MISLRKRVGLLLIFFVFASACLAQFRYRTIRCKQDSSLKFPILVGKNRTATKKINEYLQMDFFETTTSKTPEAKLFEDLRFIDDDVKRQTGYTSISHQIESNTTKLFSIVFEIEGMGAYPTAYKKYYNFNPVNGELLTADSVFTSEGIETIKKILMERRDRDIDEWIKSLKEASENTFNEDSSFIVEKFADCNSSAHENNMYIGKEKIRFYKDDCFPHAWGPYEANLDIEFTFKELEKYLSAFGKKILFTK